MNDRSTPFSSQIKKLKFNMNKIKFNFKTNHTENYFQNKELNLIAGTFKQTVVQIKKLNYFEKKN